MALKTLGILGSTGFIGNRICENFKHKYKILKINRKLKINKKLQIDYLICCAGPNKFWCTDNKKVIFYNSTNFANNIITFCKKHNVKRLIYCSTIQVLKKNNNQLIPYINWHQNIEKHLKKSKIKKIIIRLPNLFGKPKQNKKNLWNFFINLIIKNSYLKKTIKIKNRSSQKTFAMPLNFFLEFLKKEIRRDLVKVTNIINLNKYYKFRTDELLFIIKSILLKNDIVPKFMSQNQSKNKFIINNIMSNKKYLIFKKELEGLIKFVKKSF